METDTAAGTRETAKVDNNGELVRLWLDALAISSKEEENWRKRAQEVVDLYRQSSHNGESSNKKFNILHSNIETIIPALYNSTPVPDVRRRFNDPDKVAKQVADIQERCLSYSVDAYDFDHVMKVTVKDSELVGRGTARVRYKPYLDQEENVAYQEVTCEHVAWKHYRRGPANEYGDLPWEAFELFLTREELDKLSPKLSAKVTLDVSVQKTGLEKNDGRNVPEVFKRARVWEIWDKERRKVLFIAESYKDQPIREEDDPLELEGFFCTPRPIYSIQTADSLIPVVPYDIYKAQAEELERISERIIVLTEAVKAKALYDARMTEMDRLEQAEDTDHISIENPQIFADGSKLTDHIMFYPIEIIVGALEKCFEAREQIKQTIYEITGISDILRGQTQASETATAQNIKQQWGSLRIQSKQAEIQRFARDLFRLKAELFASKFEPQVLQMMTGIQITPEVIQLLRNDKMRGYRVDIESDSTIRADLTRNQQNMTQFLQGTAQFAQAMGPIVMTFKELTPAVMEVYSAFARNFKLGKQAEDALDAVATQAAQYAQQQLQQGPTPEQKAEVAKLQQQAKEHQDTMALEAKKHQDEMQFKTQQHQDEMALKVQQHNDETALRAQELQQGAQIENQKIAAQDIQQQREHQVKREEIGTNADIQREQIRTSAANENRKQTHEETKSAAETEGKQNEIAVAAAALDKVGKTLEKVAEKLSSPKKTKIIRDKSGTAIGAETSH
jgi:Membrane protein involved in colicin uptake